MSKKQNDKQDAQGVQQVSLRIDAGVHAQLQKRAEMLGISLQEALRVLFGIGYPIFMAGTQEILHGRSPSIGGFFPDMAKIGARTIKDAEALYGVSSVLHSRLTEPVLEWLGVVPLLTRFAFLPKRGREIDEFVEKVQRMAKLQKEATQDLAAAYSDGQGEGLPGEAQRYLAQFDAEMNKIDRGSELMRFQEEKLAEFYSKRQEGEQPSE